MATTSSGIVNKSPGSSDFEVSGEGFGLFAGYNIQNGNLVYGGELGFMSSAGALEQCPLEDFTNVIDVHARVGCAMDRVLLNGFVGYSMATAEQNPAVRPDWDMSGVAYGVGADFAITDSIFEGLTLEQHQWEGDTSNVLLGTQSYDPTTIILRLGYNL